MSKPHLLEMLVLLKASLALFALLYLLPLGIAALLYGVSFWWQGRYSVPALGVLIPTWSYYTMGAVFAFAWETLLHFLAARAVTMAARKSPMVAGT